MRNEPRPAASFSLILSCMAGLILLMGGIALLWNGRATRDRELLQGRDALAATEFEQAQEHLATALATRPLDTLGWELLARHDLFVAISIPSAETLSHLSKSLSMAYLSGLNVPEKSAMHRLRTALWTRNLLPDAITPPESAMQRDITLLSDLWKIKELAALAKETNSAPLMRKTIPAGSTRLEGFNYYLSKAAD